MGAGKRELHERQSRYGLPRRTFGKYRGSRQYLCGLSAIKTKQRSFMERRVIHTENAPKAIGPYSQAIRSGDTVFCAGQIPLDPATMKLLEGDITVQTRRALTNLSNVLEAAGSSLSRVCK